MQLNLAALIGLLFTIYGVLLVGYGAFFGQVRPSQGVAVDVIWGGALLVFGIVLLGSARRRIRGRRRR